MIYLEYDFLKIVILFLAVWSASGIAAELLWSFYWATVRDVYPIIPPMPRSLFLKNILRSAIAGPLDVILVWYYIKEVRKSVRKDSDDQGGRLVYRDLIPDPPVPKNTKPTLR